MRNNYSNGINKYAKYAEIPLRLGLSLIFIYDGWGKLTSIQKTAELFYKIGMPMPDVMAWVIGLLELLSGIAVLLGIFTSIAALLIALDMIIAIYFTYGFKSAVLFSRSQFEIALLLMALSLALSQSTVWSIDSIRKEKKSGRQERLFKIKTR